MQTNIKDSQFINLYSDKIEKHTTKVVIQTLNEIIVGDFHHRPKLRVFFKRKWTHFNNEFGPTWNNCTLKITSKLSPF